MLLRPHFFISLASNAVTTKTNQMKHMATRTQWGLPLLFLCGLLTAACAGLPLAAEFIVKNSEIQVRGGIRIYWINNDEVLFGGPTGETRKREDGFIEMINRVSVWNIRTNEIRRYGELAGSLCYYEGYVVFWEREVLSNRLWINYGKLGETTRLERGPSQGEFDPATCRPVKEVQARPEWTKGLAVRWLRPEHGLLVLGSSDPKEALKNTPIRYCPGGEKARCMDTLLKRRESKGFEWTPFKGAYFVSSEYFYEDSRHPAGGYTRSPWPLNQLRPVWWLFPDGSIETILLPSGPWREGGSIAFLPTVEGVFVQSHNLSKTGLGNAGAYLVHGEKITKLASAYVESPSVSPDGCRVAYVHDPYDRFPREKRLSQITLRVVEFCQGGSHGIQHRRP